MTAAPMDHAVWDALCDAYGRLRNGCKFLARDAGGRSPETARNWLSGKAAIPSVALLEVMRHNAEVRARILAMLEEPEC